MEYAPNASMSATSAASRIEQRPRLCEREYAAAIATYEDRMPVSVCAFRCALSSWQLLKMTWVVARCAYRREPQTNVTPTLD
jgi:hypothetical protein